MTAKIELLAFCRRNTWIVIRHAEHKFRCKNKRISVRGNTLYRRHEIPSFVAPTPRGTNVNRHLEINALIITYRTGTIPVVQYRYKRVGKHVSTPVLLFSIIFQLFRLTALPLLYCCLLHFANKYCTVTNTRFKVPESAGNRF